MTSSVLAGVERDQAVVTAPFGAIALALDAGRVSSLRFLPASAPVAPRTRPGCRAVEQLQRYFDDPRSRFDLPLEIRGTPFQQRVWAAIAAIPSGSVRRYGELAEELAAPARAIGQACGDNRLPVVIPCHRVVGASGLGGFGHASGGFMRTVKRWLLEHEGALRGSLL